MLITNWTTYTKKYKSLLRGDSRLVVFNSILLVILDRGVVVYKDGHLKGIIMHDGKIFTSSDTKLYSSHIGGNTEWKTIAICGIHVRHHNIPHHYDKNSNTVTIYGYNMIQYKYDKYRYLSLDLKQHILDKVYQT